jgi:predicted DCC family thiol-disulfide oxidoreductase YuxK
VRETVSNPIVLYDGVCGLCNRGVRFLLKRDRHDQLRFASLQSDFARVLLRRHGVDANLLDTLYAVTDYGQPSENLRARADAILFLARGFGGVWNVTRPLDILPGWVGERAYDLLARHRYRFFGKYESCPLMDRRHRHKFLGELESRPI